MKLLLLSIVILCTINGWSQSQSRLVISGCVVDKSSRQGLSRAAVALHQSVDTTRAINELSNTDGHFEISAGIPGNYVLHITYLGYEPLNIPIQFHPGKRTLFLDTLFMEEKVLILKLVEIREVRPSMSIKKDTIEFNSDAFKTRPNALLEDLLRRLPGLHVNKDGTLTAQGQVVKKVLVEGQPFYDDNLILALKNLPAGIVDKVQLIDRKSEQSQTSGINDGSIEKVINVTIKKEIKNEFVGRFAAGYGTDKRFAANASISRFNGKDQFSLIGSGNNISNSGFLDAASISRNGNGINRDWNGDINYSKMFNENLKISTSYIGNIDHISSYRSSIKQNLLPDSIYYYTQDTRSEDNNSKHKIMNHLEYKPDSLHSVIVDAGFSFNRKSNKADNTFQSMSNQGLIMNNGSICNSKLESSPGLFVSVFLAKKFKRRGRNLSSFWTISRQDNDHKGLNKFYNTFINPDGEFLGDSLNQNNSLRSVNRSVAASISYAQSISKSYILETTYSYTGGYSASDKLTNDYDSVNGTYSKSNDSLSNSFESQSHSHSIHIGISSKTRKGDYGIGTNMEVTVLESESANDQSKFRRIANNFYPNAYLNYTFTNSRSLRIYYSGFVQVPTIEQLQPVPDNNNPLFVRHGNPNLKAAFTHRSYVSYNAINKRTFNSFNASINASITSNKILYSSKVDTLGRQVNIPVNVDGTYNIKATVTNAFPLKKANMTINAITAFNFNKDAIFTNGFKGIASYVSLSQIISSSYFHKDLFDLSFSGSVDYGASIYSINKESKVSYFTYAFSMNGNLNLPLGIMTGLYFDYQLNTGRAEGYNANISLLNGYLAKSLFPQKQILLKLQAFDLLNKNKNIIRVIGGNYISDEKTNVLQRFFMISITYYLKQAGAKAK